jgi:hypothetical protein
MCSVTFSNPWRSISGPTCARGSVPDWPERPELGDDRARDRLVEVGILEHEEGGVAAELE